MDYFVVTRGLLTYPYAGHGTREKVVYQGTNSKKAFESIPLERSLDKGHLPDDQEVDLYIIRVEKDGLLVTRQENTTKSRDGASMCSGLDRIFIPNVNLEEIISMFQECL